MHDKTLAEQAAQLAAGELTTVELVDHYLDRIERFSANLNAYLEVDAAGARTAAANADEQRQAGNAGVLTGIPIAHKDIFCTTNMPTHLWLAHAPELSITLQCNRCRQTGQCRLYHTGQGQHG